jgi:GH18 family chitinase
MLVLPSLAQASSFQVGGYLENWKDYTGYDNFNTVYYAFLTLDSKPNADTPNDQGWNGENIYETMTLAPIMDVITKTDPLWDNEYEWQRSKMQQIIDDSASAGKTFMWAVGGWSDLQRTLTDAQIPAFVDKIVELLKYEGDGVDFDWEHLSTGASAALKTQQRAVLGKTIKALRSALNANGLHDKKISYTTRWNCFWTSADAPSYNALPFDSDGECLDTFQHASSDDVDWVNLMMYDAGPGTAFNGVQHFGMDEYNAVLDAGAEVLPKSKIVMGFEPGNQAVEGIWEGFDLDLQVIDKMKAEGHGGVMFWALNEAESKQNPGTPASSSHSWQGNTGANAQYIAGLVNSGEVVV